MIDNTATHPTPEGLMLTLTPAGIQPRFSAWLIDFAIRVGIIMAISTVTAFFGKVGFAVMMIVYFLIYWLYPVFFEVYRDGMTPGKRSQGIYVCHDDGTPISLQASMIRNLLRVADFLPMVFTAGVLTMMFNRRSQRIGDVVAGTLVVYRQQDDVDKLYKSMYGMVATPNSALQKALQSQQNQVSLENASFDMSSALFFYPLQLTEQQALVSFAERLPFLSKPRQQEISMALAPLVTPKVTPETMGQLQSTSARDESVRLAVIQRAAMIQGQGQPSQHRQFNNSANHANPVDGINSINNANNLNNSSLNNSHLTHQTSNTQNMQHNQQLPSNSDHISGVDKIKTDKTNNG